MAPIPDRTFATLLREVTAVLNLYHARGLIVRDVHADHEFAGLRDALRPVAMNIVAPDSHVGEVERSIRTIKERLRACVHGLPFKRLPKLLIQSMVADAVRCLNSFPWKHGISDTLSPATIVTGVATPDYAHMRLELGAYVQVFEDNAPSNTPRARSLGAIALMPTGNAQGDYYFMSLSTGARISRHAWTEVPLTDTAIARVEALAFADGQPLIQDRGLVVEWRPDHPIDDYEYDGDYDDAAHPAGADDDYDAHDYAPIDGAEVADLLADVAPFVAHEPANAPLVVQGAAADAGEPNHDNVNNNADFIEYEVTDESETDVDEGHNSDPDTDERADGTPNAPDGFEDANDANQGAQGFEDANDANRGAQGAPNDDHSTNQGAQGHPYNLRERTRIVERFASAMDEPHSNKSYYPPRQLTQQGFHLKSGRMDEAKRFAMNYVMTQMSAKVGLRKHGEGG